MTPALFWLRFDPTTKCWTLHRPEGEGDPTPYYRLLAPSIPATKKDAVWWAAKDVRGWAEGNQKPARLNIGGVGTGNRILLERSYLCDRRDRKG